MGPDYEEDCEDERFHQRFLRQQGDFQNAWLDYAGLSHIIEVICPCSAPLFLELPQVCG